MLARGAVAAVVFNAAGLVEMRFGRAVGRQPGTHDSDGSAAT
jgi:hypothetical protein